MLSVTLALTPPPPFETNFVLLAILNFYYYIYIGAHSLYSTVDDSSDELKMGPTRKKIDKKMTN